VFSVTIIDRLFVSFAPHLGTCFGLQHYVLINSFHAENHEKIGMIFRPFIVKETDYSIRGNYENHFSDFVECSFSFVECSFLILS
jgi:hypothetical protein